MKTGRPRNLETPKDFLDLWDEYKKHIDDNPDLIQDSTNKGLQTRTVKKPYLRAGFESYAYRKYGKTIHQYIDNYNDEYSEFLGVVTCARKEWEEDQVSGTMTGRYKAPNLTARMNNLTERTDVTTGGSKISKIEIEYIKPKDVNSEDSSN